MAKYVDSKSTLRENKSSVIARLMMQAVEGRRIQKQRARAIDAIFRRRRECHTQMVPAINRG